MFVPLLGACNMAISETPVFTEEQSAAPAPRDGIWVADDPECPFEASTPQARWPSCAMWIVASGSGREIDLRNGKGEAQSARVIMADGRPRIMQIQWHDDAKDDGKTFYVFFGLEPGPVQSDGTFIAARSWEVKCGTKRPEGSDIEPYPGINRECRPSSQQAVRSAVVPSRATAEMAMSWRWLRPDGR